MVTLNDPYSGERFEKLRSEITARFVTVCGDLPPRDFHILMERLTREQVRGELSSRYGPYEARPAIRKLAK